MKRIRVCAILAMLSLVMGMFSCSEEENPYLDVSKAGIEVVAYGADGMPLQDGDTVEIFATDTFHVELTLQAQMGSFELRTPKNVFLPDGDTVISRSAFDEKGEPWSFPFAVSLYDTGWDTIHVSAELSDGSTMADSLVLYYRSPLDQSDISAQPGELVDLITEPVEDDLVLYVWRFGDDSVVHDQPRTKRLFDEQALGSGELYVKRVGSVYKTPSDSFSFNISDRTPPVCTYVSDSLSADSAHIYTGNIPYHFEVRVEDAYSGIGETRVNGADFDTCRATGARSRTCVHVFNAIPTNESALQVIVLASDVAGNACRDTVWIHYDSSLVSTPTVQVLDPAADHAVVSQRSLVVRGDVRNMYTYDTLLLIPRVNGAIDTSAGRVVTSTSTGWSCQLTLTDPDTNYLAFMLVDVIANDVNEVLHTAYRAVVLDTTQSDSTGPSIITIMSDGILVSDGFVSSEQEIPLTVSAFDPSGVDSVLIDGVPATLRPSDVYAGRADLVHGSEGNTVVVEAVDAVGNTTRTTRLIYYNHRPRIEQLPASAYLEVGEEYRDSVGASDLDNDTLTITLLIKARTGDKIITAGAGGAFSWVPEAGDTGVVPIVVQVRDGYPGRAEDSLSVVVTAPGSSTEKANFVIDESDFPGALVAGHDTLSTVLSIDQPPGSGTYLFSVRLSTGDQRYLMRDSQDSLFTWLPAVGDTGMQTLEVVVTSGSGLADTLMPTLRIKAPLKVTFVDADTSVAEDAGQIDIPVVLSRRSAGSVTVSYGISDAATDADSSDVRLPHTHSLVFAAGDTVETIPATILDDSITESLEKLTLVLQQGSGDEPVTVGRQSTFACFIVDNDTSAGTDSLSIVSADSSGAEGNYEVPIRIRLNGPAQKEIGLDVSLSGTATSGSDYRLSPLSYTLSQGMRDTVIMLRILDDTVCERLSENVWVNLSSNTPDVEILDGSYSYSISPSIENCPKLVLFVHGSDRLRPIESRIVDTLSLLGVDIHTVQPGGISNITPEDYAAIIVSTSVTDSRVGERLRSAAAPVLCMSLPNYLTLGLASDTGHDFNSSIQVQVAMGGLSGSVQITLSYESIPWAYAESKAEVIATVVNGDIIQPQGENAAEKAVIHRYDVGDFSSQFAEGGPPARRCTFPICQASGRRGVPQYTLAWWKLLKYCFGWTAGIDVSRFIRN